MHQGVSAGVMAADERAAEAVLECSRMKDAFAELQEEAEVGRGG